MERRLEMKKLSKGVVSSLLVLSMVVTTAVPAKALQIGTDIVYGTSLTQIINFDKYEAFDGTFTPCNYIPSDVSSIKVTRYDMYGKADNTQTYNSYSECSSDFLDDFLDTDFEQCTGSQRICLGDYELEVDKGDITDSRRFTVWVSDLGYWQKTGEVLPTDANTLYTRSIKLKNDNARSEDVSFTYDTHNNISDDVYRLLASGDSYNFDDGDGTIADTECRLNYTGSSEWILHREHSYEEVDRCYLKDNPDRDLNPWNKVMDGVEVGMDVYIPFYIINSLNFNLEHLGLIETNGYVKSDGSTEVSINGTSPYITQFNITRTVGDSKESVDISRYTDGDIRFNSEGRFVITAKTRGTHTESISVSIDATAPVFEGAISDNEGDTKLIVYDYNLSKVTLDGVDLSEEIKNRRLTIERYYLGVGDHKVVAKDSAGHKSEYTFRLDEHHSYVPDGGSTVTAPDEDESVKVTQVVNLISKSINTPNRISISWKNQKYADGYQVRYSRKADMSASTTKTVKGNSISINGVTGGKLYHVRVRAYQKADDGTMLYGSSWADASEILYVPASGKVAKVGGVKVQPGGKSKAIKVSWNKAKNATRYVIEYWQKGHQNATLKSVSVAKSVRSKVFVVNGGKQYQARVRAENHTTVTVPAGSVSTDTMKVTGNKADVVVFGSWSSIATGRSNK